MGYRIDYDRDTGHYEVLREYKWRLPILTFLCFGLFLFLISWFWPEGMAVLRDLAIPGDNAVTVQALQNMVERLRQGSTIHQAVEAFCEEVIRFAHSSD